MRREKETRKHRVRSGLTGSVIAAVVTVLLLSLFACSGKNDEPGVTAGTSGTTSDPAGPVTTQPQPLPPVATQSPVRIETQEDLARISFKVDRPRTLKSYLLGGTADKTITIQNCYQMYNDDDLAFPTVLVEIYGTVTGSKYDDVPALIGYEVCDYTGLPASSFETGTVELGYFAAGQTFYYVLEFKNLEPGGRYELILKDGKPLDKSETANTEIYGEERKIKGYFMSGLDSSLLEEGSYPDDIRDLSVCFGNKYVTVSFVFVNETGAAVGCPVSADMKFESESGETIYEGRVALTADNFKRVSVYREKDDHIRGKILISGEEFYESVGVLKPGTFYITFSNEEGWESEKLSLPYLYDDDCVGASEEAYIWDTITFPKAEPGVIY